MNLPQVYMCSQSWNPASRSLPIPSLWVIPVHQPQASCILHQTCADKSFLIWYYTCFNPIFPNHPTLPLSHRVQKTVLYICGLFTSGGQGIGASASASVILITIQGLFPLGLTGLISLLSKGLLRVFSNTLVQNHQFSGAQPFLLSSSHSHTWLMEKP